MFRRNSSTRLGRSKSTSSVHSKHESIDPEVARQHAHAAATLAFARAQERTNADLCYSRGQQTPRVQTSNYERQSSSQPIDSSFTGEHVVKRQQSVRFAGPNAVQRRQSTNNRHTIQPKASTATLKPVALTTSAPVPAAYRPPSRSSSIGKASFGKATAATEFNKALAAYDEYYAREPEVPSTPSSYRRLRKSKSMFSPLKAPSVFYSNGTPERETTSRLGRQNSTTSSRTTRTARALPYQAALRAPKSMSFLRGGRDGGFTHRTDEGVQMARDRFFQHAAQQRLREQPSFLFRSRTQKNIDQKQFRKSVRSGSGNSDPLPTPLPEDETTPSSPVNFKLREKARKASKTIKFKLKRVFGFIKEEPIAIPNQQVEAHETHVRQYSCPPNEDAFNDIPYPDDESLSRVASRVPSIRIQPSKEKLRSHAGSLRSARSFTTDLSDDNSNSRVTSWTSTAANTVTSQAARALSEREQQRLSIINENGTHISSSSFRRKRLTNQFSAYPLVRPPSRDGPAPTQGVDSARVYSALMKRLDENGPHHKPAHKASEETLRTPRRSSSINNGKENQKYSTIRHVPSEEGHSHQWVKTDSVHAARAEDLFGFTGTHTHQWAPADVLREARMRSEDDVFFDKSTVTPAPRPPQHHRAYSNASTSVVSIQQPSNKTSFYTVPEEVGRTPQEIAISNEPVVIEPPKKGLRESRSTFFGGSTWTGSRTTSPFRKSLAETKDGTPAMKKDPNATPSRKSMFLAVDGGFSSEEVVDDKTDSVSLYSRTTSGQTLAANSALSLLIDQHEQRETEQQLDTSKLSQESSKGDVVILDRSTYRSLNRRTGGGSCHSVSSSAGSNEWKRWMSSEVAKLERGKENHRATAPPFSTTGYGNSTTTTNANAKPYINYTIPKAYQPTTVVGHLRESAQIDDEDVEIAPSGKIGVRLPVGMVYPPPLNLNQNQNQNQDGNVTRPFLKPILKNKSSVSLVETSGNASGYAIARGNTPLSCGNTPLVRENGSGIGGVTAYVPPPPPIPPPIPGRNPLRAVESRNSLRSVVTVTGVPASSLGSGFAGLTGAGMSAFGGGGTSSTITNQQTSSNSNSNTVSGTGSGSASGSVGRSHGRNVLHKKHVSKASLRSVRSFNGSEAKVVDCGMSGQIPAQGQVQKESQTPRLTAKLVRRKRSGQVMGERGKSCERERERRSERSGTDLGSAIGEVVGGEKILQDLDFERAGAGSPLEDFYKGEGNGKGILNPIVDPIPMPLGPTLNDQGIGGSLMVRKFDESVGGVAGGIGEMSESDAQAMGSRKMVELFLNTRRKRIAGGSEEGGVFL